MCRRKLPAAVPPCNQSQICFRIIKCLRAIISSASSCISFKTSFSHGKEKVKTFVSSSSLFMKTHCFYHTLWLPYLNLCSRNLFFFFFPWTTCGTQLMNTVLQAILNYMSEWKPRVGLIIQNHFIFDFQIHQVNLPWEVHLPANALLELILKYVCIP